MALNSNKSGSVTINEKFAVRERFESTVIVNGFSEEFKSPTQSTNIYPVFATALRLTCAPTSKIPPPFTVPLSVAVRSTVY